MTRNKNSAKIKNLVILGMLTAIMFVLNYTPIGYLHIGIIEISFFAIPVAIAAYTTGPVGGAVIGGMFGLTSFLQAGAIIAMSPVKAVLLCFVPRILDGLVCGLVATALKKHRVNPAAAGSVIGILAASLNTMLFLPLLIVFFGSVVGYTPDKNVILFAVGLAGVNAVVEAIAATIVTGAVCTALFAARLIDVPVKKAEV